MTEPSFHQLYAQFNQFYQDEQWAAALDMWTRAFDRFPEWAADIYYSRLCMIGRLDDKPQGLRLLQEMLDAGIWYSEPMLRDSPSLQAWQGDPEFERQVQAHMDAQAQAKAPAPDTRLPEVSPPYPLLLAMHGQTSTAEAEIGHWEGVTTGGYMLAMAQASQLVWAGGGLWTIEKSVPEVAEYYEQLSAAHAFDPQQVIVGGYSMGGEIALQAALTGAVPARGFVVLAPAGGPLSMEPQGCESIIQSLQGSGMRGAIILGQDDAAASPDGIRTLAAMLNENDVPCKVMSFDGGHAYPPDFDKRLLDALTFIFE